MTETDQTQPYTDVDVDLAVNAWKPGGTIRTHAIAILDALAAAGRLAVCPCLPGAPEHQHNAGGYCTRPDQDDSVAAAEARGWHRGFEHARRYPPRPVATGQMGTVPAPRSAAQQMIADLTRDRDENHRIADSLRQDLSDAGDVIAIVREAAEQLGRALAGRLPSLPDVRAAVERIDRALAAYDAPGGTQPTVRLDVGDLPYNDPLVGNLDWQAAGDWSHEIAFDDTGDWSIGHPDGCPGQRAGDCDVYRLAEDQLPVFDLGAFGGHRYQCSVNGLGDRFLIGDRIGDDRAATLAQIADEAAQLDDDLAAGRVADRLGDPPPATAVCGEKADTRGFFRCRKPAGHHGERHTATLPGGSFTWGYVPTPDEQTEG